MMPKYCSYDRMNMASYFYEKVSCQPSSVLRLCTALEGKAAKQSPRCRAALSGCACLEMLSLLLLVGEHLRCHDGYRQTCESACRDKYADLYADFGNVREDDFWSWWNENAELFAEPPIRHVSVEHSISTNQNMLTIFIPFENKLSVSMMQIRRLFEPQVQKAARKKTQSLDKYPVATKPVLRTLHEHLLLWDAKQQNPTVPNN